MVDVSEKTPTERVAVAEGRVVMLPKTLDAVLKGRKGPFRDVAILNAAAALLVADRARDLEGGILLARKSIDSGEAEGRLDRLLAVSND